MTDSATRAWDCCKLNIPYLGLFSTAIRNVLPKEGQLGEGGATQAKDSVIVISSFAVFTARRLCCPDENRSRKSDCLLQLYTPTNTAYSMKSKARGAKNIIFALKQNSSDISD